MSAAPPTPPPRSSSERRRGLREPTGGEPSRAPLGWALVVAALGLSLGLQALMAGERRAALWLLGIGFVASAVSGALGWRIMQQNRSPPLR